MGPLIFIARLHQIKRQKSTLNFRLMQVQSQKNNLTAQISNAQKSSQMQQSVNDYMLQSQKAMLYQNFTNFVNYQVKFIPPQMQQMAMQQYTMQFHAQIQMFDMNMAMQSQVNQLSNDAQLQGLNAIDQQLEQEQIALETQIKLLAAEEQNVQKQMDEEIKNSAPKFA